MACDRLYPAEQSWVLEARHWQGAVLHGQQSMLCFISLFQASKLCACHAQGKATKESGDKTGSVKTVDGKRAKV